MNIDKEFLDVKDIALILQISEKSVRVLLNSKELKGKKVGRKYIVHKEDLINFIREDD